MIDALATSPMTLAEHEDVIRRGLSTFVDVGSALFAIRQDRLYREAGYDTFDAYCRERWDMTRIHAHRLIAASGVVGNLLPIGNILPATESQARPLTKLPEKDQPEVWQEVLDTAATNNGQPIITAEFVESVVSRRTKSQDETTTLKGCTTNDLRALIAQGKKYATIYADPPWAYGNQATRAATSNHYETMSVDDICSLCADVGGIAALATDDAHLHLWTTNAFLFEAQKVIDAWGFAYKSCFVWCKTQMGIGNYWRVSHEFLLLGVRGSFPFEDKGLMSWGEFGRGQHSAKPDAVRGMIERAGRPQRIELFGRAPAPGWTVWGNEVDKSLMTLDVECV